MKGENLFNFVERIKFLEGRKYVGKLLESEAYELNNLIKGAKLFSLQELKDYHSYVRILLGNSAEIKEELLERFKEVCSDESFEMIKDIVERVCERNIFIKNMREKEIDLKIRN